MTQHKQMIVVSPEMISFVGGGELPACEWPEGSACLIFSRMDGGFVPMLYFLPRATEAEVRIPDGQLVFIVSREACRRIFGGHPAQPCVWHLPNSLRGLAISIIGCEGTGEARKTLQLARSIELLCQSFAAMAQGDLVQAEGDFGMSETDTARIAAARRLIDENWQEKLTLGTIARQCGLNRDKLARGFRAAFGCSVGEFLSEKRLDSARTLLLGTDLPVSTIAYRCGYLNNASFTRAFSRRFGTAPSQCRIGALAA